MMDYFREKYIFFKDGFNISAQKFDLGGLSRQLLTKKEKSNKNEVK